jgi:chloramphenicol 3-O-phosphotransferase
LPFHYRFAIFEVMAHLEYLERREVLRADRSGGVYRWMRGVDISPRSAG